MENIPKIRRAQLVAQMAIKMETGLDADVRLLKAQGIDVPEMVRQYLRKEVPRIKKKLANA